MSAEKKTIRTHLSNLSMLAALLLVLGLLLFNELRLRSYVNYPWLEDRDDVVRKLDNIDQRLEQFERRVVILLERQPLDLEEVPPAPE